VNTPLARALPAVYAAAALRVAFPLVVLPVMAARLGADQFGQLSLFLVWAGLISTVVEGGFLAAATRDAVRADAAGRARLATQVFSARCALSLLVLPLAFGVVWVFVPQASEAHPWSASLLLALLACVLGWPATWYMQASQQLHRWALVELGVYAAWLVAALALVHSVAAYLVLNIVAALLLAVLGWGWLARDLAQTPAQAPLWSRAAVRPGLRLGWTMMPVAVAGAAYSYALPAVASSQMERSQLGIYYLADRIVRSVLNAAEPMFQLVYPRIVARFALGPRVALRYAARWAGAGLAVGAALLAIAVLGWPLVRGNIALAGQGVDALLLEQVFAVLGLLLPLLLGWKFFGYWMLGSGGFDRAYRACVFVGGVFGVTAAWLLAQRGAVALAWVALTVEAVVIATALAGIAITLQVRGRAR